MDGFSSPRLVPLAGQLRTYRSCGTDGGRDGASTAPPLLAKTIRARVTDRGVARPHRSVPPSPARFPFHFCSPSGHAKHKRRTQLSRLSATYTCGWRGRPEPTMRGLQEEFRGGVQVQPPASSHGGGGGSDGRALSWWSGDPEAKRRRRVAGYKSYAVEARVKASIRKGFRWIKDRCTGLVRRY